jgi:hypothetical protein
MSFDNQLPRPNGRPMDTGAPTGTGSARNTVNQPSSLRFDVHATNSPRQFHVRLGNNVVGTVSGYTDPQHGDLYSATFHPRVLAMATHLSPTRRGFTSVVDAANHIADNTRDIAQIENIGQWRA